MRTTTKITRMLAGKSPSETSTFGNIVGTILILSAIGLVGQMLFSANYTFVKDPSDWVSRLSGEVVEIEKKYRMVKYNYILDMRNGELPGNMPADKWLKTVLYNPGDPSQIVRSFGAAEPDWVATTGYVQERRSDSYTVRYEIIEEKIGKLPGREKRDRVGSSPGWFYYKVADPSVLTKEIYQWQDVLQKSIPAFFGFLILFLMRMLRKKPVPESETLKAEGIARGKLQSGETLLSYCSIVSKGKAILGVFMIFMGVVFLTLAILPLFIGFDAISSNMFFSVVLGTMGAFELYVGFRSLKGSRYIYCFVTNRGVYFVDKSGKTLNIAKENIRKVEYIPKVTQVILHTRDSKKHEFIAKFNGGEMAKAIRGIAG